MQVRRGSVYTRRDFIAAAGSVLATVGAPSGALSESSDANMYRTPYRCPHLLVAPSGVKGDFDERGVDDPIVFRANGQFYMLYIGWDGIGYQTGLAASSDLLQWQRLGCVGPRHAGSTYTKFNFALSSILRDKRLYSPGEAIKVDGCYLGAWHAYPSPGYEQGAAVIGLAWSRDLLRWELGEPILYPHDGAEWERGGLYRTDLLVDDGTYYLYYNAKNDPPYGKTGIQWHEQSGVATSHDLKSWTRYSGNPILRNSGINQSRSYRDNRFSSNPFVMRNGDRWVMFYFGLSVSGPPEHQHLRPPCELLALGLSPYSFTKVPEVLIDAGAPGSIDSLCAHKPSVIYHAGSLYHFYCAVAGTWTNERRGIAVARSGPW